MEARNSARSLSSLLAREARRKSGLSTSRVEVWTDKQKPALTLSSCVEIPGIRGRCAGGVLGEYLPLGEETCVVASAGSKTIEDETDLMEARDKGGLEAVSMGSPAWQVR